jgi:hypothetical protein
MDKVAINVVALLTLASKIETIFVGHVFWEHIWRVDQSVTKVEYPRSVFSFATVSTFSATRLFLLLTSGNLFIDTIRGSRITLIPMTLFIIEVSNWVWRRHSVHEWSVLIILLGSTSLGAIPWR